MVALKGGAIDAFLAQPDHAMVLVYGPDTGLVAERAKVLLRSVDTGGDPFAAVTLDGDALAGTPGRLVEEALTVPLFGGRRAIRVTRTTRDLMPALEPLLAAPPQSALIVVEAGDLSPKSGLRKAFEKAKGAAALPCYLDDERAIERLVESEAAAAGLAVSRDASLLLRGLLGGDRLASRREIEKLICFCLGRERIEVEDVQAIVGDAAANDLAALADAVGLGDRETADRLLRRCLADGTMPGALTGVLQRHFAQLIEARIAIDRGATAEAAMRDLRPPVFYKRQQGFRRQLALWSPAALERARSLIAETELSTRRSPALGAELIGRTVLMLAGATATRRR